MKLTKEQKEGISKPKIERITDFDGSEGPEGMVGYRITYTIFIDDIEEIYKEIVVWANDTINIG